MPSPSSQSQERHAVLLLLPYVLLALLYMATFQPLWQLPPETLSVAVLKAVPIWYLAAYVGITPNFATNHLAVGSRAGLVLSSLGDICLVWRQSLFIPGMLFFALAHMAYIYASAAWQRRGSYVNGQYVRESVLVCGLSYLFVCTGIQSWLMAVLVLGYSTLLFVMANLALQRHLQERNRASLCGALGGVSFCLSDLLIAVTKWKFPLPFSEGIIMITYYLAQALISYSAVCSVRARQRT